MVLISGASGRFFGTGRTATKYASAPSDGAGDRGADQRHIDIGVEEGDDEQADEGADHEHFAVREIEQVEHAEDQRVADRHQRIGRAEHQAVDQLLVEHGVLVVLGFRANGRSRQSPA